MKDNKKQLTTYNKMQFIRLIARNCETITVDTVKEVIEELENQMINVLATADDKHDVSVKLFDGFTVNSSFLPEREQINSLTGEMITAQSKIKTTAHLTRTLKEKITGLAKVGK